MLAEKRREDDFVERVEHAERSRFEKRPVYKLGDVLQPTVPVVEGVWGVNGRTIVDTSGDVSDPDVPIIEASYAIAQPGKAWRILYLTPAANSACKARAYMGRLGHQVYWPREVVPVIRGRGEARKLVPLVRPLFPGYALVHLSQTVAPEDLLRGAESWSNGVSGLVSVARVPVTVPDVIVERVVAREREGEFNHTDRAGAKVIPKMRDWIVEGGLVIVNAGPFREFTGVIEEIDREQQRLKVAVALFGRATPIELDLADVREP